METQLEPGRPRKCQKCNWAWLSKSKAIKVSCPSCGAKVELQAGGKSKK